MHCPDRCSNSRLCRREFCQMMIIHANGAGVAGIKTGLQALCRCTKCAFASGLWCGRQTHHCHVVVPDLCTLGAVKECPGSWPHLGDLLVEGHCPLQLPRLLCIIGAPLVLHGTSNEREHVRLSAAGNAHCIDTHAAAWTGSVKAPVFSGPWGHLLCSLAQSKASLQLDVYVSSLSGSHNCACSLYHVLGNRCEVTLTSQYMVSAGWA